MKHWQYWHIQQSLHIHRVQQQHVDVAAAADDVVDVVGTSTGDFGVVQKEAVPYVDDSDADGGHELMVFWSVVSEFG